MSRYRGRHRRWWRRIDWVPVVVGGVVLWVSLVVLWGVIHD